MEWWLDISFVPRLPRVAENLMGQRVPEPVERAVRSKDRKHS